MLRGFESIRELQRQLWDHPIREGIFNLFLETYFLRNIFGGQTIEGNKGLSKDKTDLNHTSEEHRITQAK